MASDADDGLDYDLERSRLFHQDPGKWLIEELGETDVQRLATALASGVPRRSFAVFSRWWQLETYLRLMLYIELKGSR